MGGPNSKDRLQIQVPLGTMVDFTNGANLVKVQEVTDGPKKNVTPEQIAEQQKQLFKSRADMLRGGSESEQLEAFDQ
eukprot:467823-Alexandrium_andersonii.AAC.1